MLTFKIIFWLSGISRRKHKIWQLTDDLDVMDRAGPVPTKRRYSVGRDNACVVRKYDN
jgi:hypothetical protein